MKSHTWFVPRSTIVTSRSASSAGVSAAGPRTWNTALPDPLATVKVRIGSVGLATYSGTEFFSLVMNPLSPANVAVRVNLAPAGIGVFHGDVAAKGFSITCCRVHGAPPLNGRRAAVARPLAGTGVSAGRPAAATTAGTTSTRSIEHAVTSRHRPGARPERWRGHMGHTSDAGDGDASSWHPAPPLLEPTTSEAGRRGAASEANGQLSGQMQRRAVVQVRPDDLDADRQPGRGLADRHDGGGQVARPGGGHPHGGVPVRRCRVRAADRARRRCGSLWSCGMAGTA